MLQQIGQDIALFWIVNQSLQAGFFQLRTRGFRSSRPSKDRKRFRHAGVRATHRTVGCVLDRIWTLHGRCIRAGCCVGGPSGWSCRSVLRVAHQLRRIGAGVPRITILAGTRRRQIVEPQLGEQTQDSIRAGIVDSPQGTEIAATVRVGIAILLAFVLEEKCVGRVPTRVLTIGCGTGG